MPKHLFYALIICSQLGCETLTQLNDAIDDAKDLPDVVDTDGLDEIFEDLTLVSAVPSSNFKNDGMIDFSMLSDPRFKSSDLKVQVENDDGTFSDCEHDGGETIPGSARHLISMIIDGSGSMELSYPPDEYGDVCVTCPHDPSRERIPATATLVRAVQHDAPQSQIAIAEFGPDVFGLGFEVTTLHHDFSTDTESLVNSLDEIRGYEEEGTPMYDSLGEMITAISQSSRDGKRSLILLTDGLDNESERYDLGSVADYAQENDVTIFAVGLGPASVNDLHSDTESQNIDAILALQELAYQTGGFYAAVEQPGGLNELYQTIAATLTDGYQTDRYRCVPKKSPTDECGCPNHDRGDPIVGRIVAGQASLPWKIVTP